MKLSYSLVALAVALAAVSCGPKSSLKFDQTTLEMGELTDNSSVYPTVKVYNTSSKPIEIDSILTSTKSITFLGEAPVTVNPADTVSLEFMAHTESMEGNFATLVQIYVKGDKKPAEVIIKGHVKVTPKNAEEQCIYPLCNLLLNKREVMLGDVPLGKKVSDTIMVYNPTQKPISIMQIGSSPVTAKVIDRRIREGNVSYIVVNYECNDVLKLGLNLEMVRFDTGDSRCTENAILVQANVVETFDHLTKEQLENAPIAKIDNPEHDFGKIKLGEVYNHDFKLTNEGNTPLVIRAVSTTCGCTIAQLSKKVIAPGETITISAKFDTKGREGMQQKAIDVVTNAPNAPHIKLWILADIVK